MRDLEVIGYLETQFSLIFKNLKLRGENFDGQAQKFQIALQVFKGCLKVKDESHQL